MRVQLGGSCRTLLGHDGHLVAISLDGVIEVIDPVRRESVCRFQTQGPLNVEPCISGGKLYAGTRGHLTAYSLAGLSMGAPRTKPLWQLPLEGTPIHALTPVGDRLYVTLASAGWWEVHVVEGIDRLQPARPRPVHGSAKVSWLAADETQAKAFFFSEDRGGAIALHAAGTELETCSVSLEGLADGPIAFLGGSVFGVFGDERRLYRIDASTGAVEESLDDDTQLFALTHDEDDEWDRDGVTITSSGIGFSRAGIRDSFEPLDRVKAGPLIVHGCAVAIGMEDGRVRIYDLAHLPRHEVWRVGSGSGAAITALASFDAYIAAANRDGLVEVRELRATQ